MFKLSEEEVIDLLNENLQEQIMSYLNGKILINWIPLKVFDMIVIHFCEKSGIYWEREKNSLKVEFLKLKLSSFNKI